MSTKKMEIVLIGQISLEIISQLGFILITPKTLVIRGKIMKIMFKLWKPIIKML